MNWDGESVVALAKAYAARPQLWDTQHRQYRSGAAKHAAWAELGAAFGCSPFEIKKKMNSVLASHRREKAKIRSGHLSQWFLYEHLAFLPSHLDNPDAADQGDAKSDDELHAEYLEVPSEEMELIIKQEPRAPSPPAPRPRPRPRPREPPRPRAPPRRPEARDPRFKDECATFGEYIASALRRHQPRTRSMIKHAINNILFEQEMKRFGSQPQYDGNPLSDDDGED